MSDPILDKIVNAPPAKYHSVELNFIDRHGLWNNVPLHEGEPFEAGMIDADKVVITQKYGNYGKYAVFTKILGTFENFIGKVVKFALVRQDQKGKKFIVKHEFLPGREAQPAPPASPQTDNKFVLERVGPTRTSEPPVIVTKTVILSDSPLDLGGPALLAVDEYNYAELTNINVLRQDDILPGSDFKLGDHSTYSRELLTVNFNPDSEAYALLQQAKTVGEAGIKAGKTPIQIAKEVAGLIRQTYAARGEAFEAGVSQTIGEFFKNGGVCRHKAALLQMALQQAGVRSRYVRGILAGGGQHAWVEVDGAGNDSFSYLIDLERGVMSSKKGLRFTAHGNLMFGLENDPHSVYLMDIQKMNVVWRPKVRAAALSATPAVPATPAEPAAPAAEPRPAPPATEAVVSKTSLPPLKSPPPIRPKVDIPPPPPGASAPKAPPPVVSEPPSATAQYPAASVVEPPPPPGYGGVAKAPAPAGEFLSIPESARAADIPIDLVRQVEPIDLARPLELPPEPTPAPEPAMPPAAEPSVSPPPQRGAFVKIGTNVIDLKKQAYLWTGEIRPYKNIRFGFGNFYYEIALGQDGQVRLANLMEKGRGTIPDIVNVSEGTSNLEAYTIKLKTVNKRPFLTIKFNRFAPRPGISPPPTSGAFELPPAPVRPAPRVSVPVEGFPIGGMALNAAFFAALGLTGFGLKKTYEKFVKKGEKADALEEAAAYGLPGGAAAIGTLVAAVAKGGTAAIVPALGHIGAGAAGVLPIAGATTLSAKLLGVDPRSDEGHLGIIFSTSLLAAPAGFATIGGTSAVGALKAGAIAVGIRLSALAGVAVAGAAVAGVATGIGLDYGIGWLYKTFIDEEGTGRWSHDIVDRDPWLAAPLVAGPYLGGAIYGLHKLYDWITEPVNMEVEEYTETAPEPVTEETEEAKGAPASKYIYIKSIKGIRPPKTQEVPVAKTTVPEISIPETPVPETSAAPATESKYIYIRTIKGMRPPKPGE